jgi:hypothetical protein
MALIRERGAAVSAEVDVEARIGVEAGRSEVVITWSRASSAVDRAETCVLAEGTGLGVLVRAPKLLATGSSGRGRP